MRDAVTTSERKIPVLGDIPVLGFLFRNTEKGKRKTNLLLVLTPYVIREQNDLRTVFERKMQERQEFLDRYFVFSDQKHYEPPLDYSRSNGLVENIRQSYIGLADRKRLEEETRPRELRVHDAQQPIEMPLTPTAPGVGLGRPGAAAPGAAPSAAPAAAPNAPAPAAPGAAPAAPPVGVILTPSVGTPPTQPATTPAPSGGAGATPAPAGGAGATPSPPGAAPSPAPPGAGPSPLPPGAPPSAPPPPPAAPNPQWSGTGAPPPSTIVPPLGSLTFVRATSPVRPSATTRTSN